MKLIKFDSYDEYQSTQAAANRQRFTNLFAEDEELLRIAEDLRTRVPEVTSGLCHGVRHGYEVRQLRSRLSGPDVARTDSAETAASISRCSDLAIHEVNPEWIGSTDFRSNSFDHGLHRALLFSRWVECLGDGGRRHSSHTNKHTAEGVSEDAAPSATEITAHAGARVVQVPVVSPKNHACPQ